MDYDKIKWEQGARWSTTRYYESELWATNTPIEVTIHTKTLKHEDGFAGASHSVYYIENKGYKSLSKFKEALKDI